MNTRYLFGPLLFAFVGGCTTGSQPADGPRDASTLNQGQLPTPAATNPTPNPEPVVTPTTTVSNNSEQPPSGNCGGKTCATGETCVSYYGVAGPRGPQFHDCVIPCKRGTRNEGCPEGKRCTSIADGPGEVCQ